MRHTFFDTKSNTLYINTNLMLPDTKGMSFRAHCKEYDKAFALPYSERLKKFCPDSVRPLIEEEIANHPGCKISEFDDL